MKEMDQDGCLVEADTHKASQPRLLQNYPGNSVRLYMRDENGNVMEIAGREEYEADTPIVTEAKEPNPFS